MDSLNMLTKRELTGVLKYIDDCLYILDEENFRMQVEELKKIIPHHFSICGLGKIGEKALMGIYYIMNFSYPEEWLDMYVENKFYAIDPIVHESITVTRPHVWSMTFQKHKGENSRKISLLSRNFGLNEGVSYGVIDTESSTLGLFSFAGFDQKPILRDIVLVKYLVPHLNQALFRVYRQNRRRKGDSPDHGSSARIELSDRETEVLNWIKKGKTNWEISMILNIRERTVKFHVSNILNKLNTVSRTQAVAKAMSLGLIDIS